MWYNDVKWSVQLQLQYIVPICELNYVWGSLYYCSRIFYNVINCPGVIFTQGTVYNTAPALSRGGSRDDCLQYRFRKARRIWLSLNFLLSYNLNVKNVVFMLFAVWLKYVNYWPNVLCGVLLSPDICGAKPRLPLPPQEGCKSTSNPEELSYENWSKKLTNSLFEISRKCQI